MISLNWQLKKLLNTLQKEEHLNTDLYRQLAFRSGHFP